MEWGEIYEIGKAPKTHSTEALRSAMAVITKAKHWRGPYFSIQRELSDRACREWVKEDVFGHTFTGSAQK